MAELSRVVRFYVKAFGLIILLNLVFLSCFGMYFEDYEGIFSTFIQGTYSKPCTAWWDVNNHFLLLYLYERVTYLLPDYNVYGVVLFAYNWACLTLSGLVLYRILAVNLRMKSWWFFVFLYCILSLDNFVNLSSTRQAFIFIAAVIGFIESRRLEGKEMNFFVWGGLATVTLFATLIRYEAVLLFSVIYMVILIVQGRFNKSALFPFLISSMVLLVHYHIVSGSFTEAKQVFIYKEKEFFDRDNIDYDKLSPEKLLDVQAIKLYGITDEEHFTLKFYDSISKSGSGKGIFSIADGLTFSSFFSTLKNSALNFYAARYFFVFCYVTGMALLLMPSSRKKRDVLQVLLVVSIPFLLCFNTVVPPRFLIPFLSVTGCIQLLMCIDYYKHNKRFLAFCAVLLLLLFSSVLNAKRMYEGDAEKYTVMTSQLLSLDKKQHAAAPIIINNLFLNSYFPVKPLGKLPRQHVLFLNFHYMSAWDFHVQSWKERCHCNTFSLKEKIEYMVGAQNLFLIDSRTFQFLQQYLLEKHHIQVYRRDVKAFNRELQVCRLSFHEE